MKKSMKTKSFETENLHGKIAVVVQLRACSQADGVHMTVDTNTMVSITEANQNFSKVARLVDELGSVVILKNNAPRYLVIDFSKADDSAIAKDEDVLEISKRLIAQNKEAYEVLAK